MACKVSSGAMFGRLFRVEDKTCKPDTMTDASPRQVHDLVKELSNSLSNDALAPSQGKLGEQSGKSMENVRSCLQAAISAFEAETTTVTEQSNLLEGLLAHDLPAQMLIVLPILEFEARKEIMRLFHHILQAGSTPVIDYIRSHQHILRELLRGCGNADVALHCHVMLRSCACHSELVVCMLEAGYATELLELTEHQVFDISSDAFCSLRQLLLTHKAVSAEYLQTHFKTFFVPYNKVLQTAEYVTKRQALRLLAELLLDRAFKKVMLLYVGEDQFLQVLMNLLRDNSRAIQADAFHAFKLFAASPKKPQRIHQILLKNRERLVKLLESIGKGDDETYLQDQRAVIQSLWMLEASASQSQTSSR